MKKIVVLALALFISLSLTAQQRDSLMIEVRNMLDQTDPAASVKAMNIIVEKYQLKNDQDAETLNKMKGIVAMSYLEAGNDRGFDKMIASMSSLFSRTTYLNMAADRLLQNRRDLKKAELLAKRTLDLYLSYKDDAAARPSYTSEGDWRQFMEFAWYFYCDTYAAALEANGKHKQALEYQEKAFAASGEEGPVKSIERYAKLLAVNNQHDKAYKLLLNMAGNGKSTVAMDELFKKMYLRRNNNNMQAYDSLYSSLRAKVIGRLKEELRTKILDIPAYEFTLMDVDGKTVSLSDFKGQIVVLDFWATWCGPCKASFPGMKKVMQQHPEVKFLFIATREKPEGLVERIQKYLAEKQYPFHVLLDRPRADSSQVFEVLSAYKGQGIPAKVVIDAKGVQRFFSAGFRSDADLINELEAKIELVKEME